MTRCFDKSIKNWCSVASWVVEIYAWSIIWNFFDLTQPQWPLTEKVLKFNMSFDDSVKRFFFSKHQNKVLKLLNSRIWKTLKSSVVIFQALETSSASWTSAASATSVASTASKGQYPQEKVWSWLYDHHWHQNNQYWSFFVEWIAKNPIFH